MKLGLGTVQFGMDYGVTNTDGRVSLAEVSAILDEARRMGVDVLDTASNYGDSERALGRLISHDDNFRIVTKTPDWRGDPPANPGALLEAAFERSLVRLNRPDVDGLLVHCADDLLSERGVKVWSAMERLRKRGLVGRLGISVYTGTQIDRVLSEFRPDIIQLPINVFDQRLNRTGHIDRIHSAGIEIHARSMFLQGVLLAKPEGLPVHLERLQAPLRRFQLIAEAAKLTPIEATLLFARSLEFDVVIVGVTTADQLKAITGAMESEPAKTIEWSDLAVYDENLIDPRMWEEFPSPAREGGIAS